MSMIYKVFEMQRNPMYRKVLKTQPCPLTIFQKLPFPPFPYWFGANSPQTGTFPCRAIHTEQELPRWHKNTPNPLIKPSDSGLSIGKKKNQLARGKTQFVALRKVKLTWICAFRKQKNPHFHAQNQKQKSPILCCGKALKKTQNWIFWKRKKFPNLGWNASSLRDITGGYLVAIILCGSVIQSILFVVGYPMWVTCCGLSPCTSPTIRLYSLFLPCPSILPRLSAPLCPSVPCAMSIPWRLTCEFFPCEFLLQVIFPTWVFTHTGHFVSSFPTQDFFHGSLPHEFLPMWDFSILFFTWSFFFSPGGVQSTGQNLMQIGSILPRIDWIAVLLWLLHWEF